MRLAAIDSAFGVSQTVGHTLSTAHLEARDEPHDAAASASRGRTSPPPGFVVHGPAKKPTPPETRNLTTQEKNGTKKEVGLEAGGSSGSMLRSVLVSVGMERV